MNINRFKWKRSLTGDVLQCNSPGERLPSAFAAAVLIQIKLWLSENSDQCSRTNCSRRFISKIIDQWSAAASTASFRIGWSWSSNEGALASLVMIQSNSTPLSKLHSDSASSTPTSHTGKQRDRQVDRETGRQTDSGRRWSPCLHFLPLYKN